MENFLAVT